MFFITLPNKVIRLGFILVCWNGAVVCLVFCIICSIRMGLICLLGVWFLGGGVSCRLGGWVRSGRFGWGGVRVRWVSLGVARVIDLIRKLGMIRRASAFLIPFWTAHFQMARTELS